MRGGQQPGDPVQRRPEVVALARLGRAGVQGHADLDARGLRPGLRRERRRGRAGGRERVARGGERRAERVADGLEDAAVVPLDGFAQESVVASQCGPHRLGALLPEPGAALDVGEEEGDGSAREVRHRVPPVIVRFRRQGGR